MKLLLAAAVAATALISATSAADARQGCGLGMHRGPRGYCRPNHGPGYVVRPRMGIFYPGRGWWDGHRYWRHREHDRHHGWRYR